MLRCELKKESRCLSLGAYEKEQKAKTEADPRDRGVQSNLAPFAHLKGDPKPTFMNLCTLFLTSKMGITEAYEKKREKEEEQTNKKEKKKRKQAKEKKEKKEKGLDKSQPQKYRQYHPPCTLEGNQGCKPKTVHNWPPQR